MADKLASPPPPPTQFQPARETALFCQELLPSLSAFPLYPQALVGNDRDSLILSELKCREARLLAGRKPGRASGSPSPPPGVVLGRLLFNFLSLLGLCWILESCLSCMWGWFVSFLGVEGEGGGRPGFNMH